MSDLAPKSHKPKVGALISPNSMGPHLFKEPQASPKMQIVKRGNKNEVVLAPRKVKTQRMVRTVLPEEKYLDKLDKIIQRDFFPDLPKLQAQVEYTDAVASNDVARIRALQMRYSSQRASEKRLESLTRRSPMPGTSLESMTRPDSNLTSADFEEDELRFGKRPKVQTTRPDTGASTVTTKTDDSVFKKPEPVRLSLDKFLSKYTSEDNASFEDLEALNDRKEKVVNGWMYKAEAEHNLNKVHRIDNAVLAADKQLMLKGTQEEFDNRPPNIDTWTMKARNNVLFYPDEAQPNIEDILQKQKQMQREIHSDNTRFKSNPWKESNSKEIMSKAAMVIAAKMQGQVDIAGNVYSNPALASITGESYGLGNSAGDKFSNVAATPSPMPGVGESPLMTWGEIEGTPFRLDAGDMEVKATDADGPKFKMQAVPERDKLAHSIVDTLGKTYHDKRKAAIEAAQRVHRTPKFGSQRSNTSLLLGMSPAARQLAAGKLGIRMTSQDRQLSQSYTPRPSSMTPKNKDVAPSPSRPVSMRKERPKAKDFFKK